MLSSISPNDATKISNNFESCTICELFFYFCAKIIVMQQMRKSFSVLFMVHEKEKKFYLNKWIFLWNSQRIVIPLQPKDNTMKQEELKKEVERVVGRELREARDFEELSLLLFKGTRERLSPTTLKRLWGYLKNEDVQTRPHTLDVLGRFVGYKGFEDFCANFQADDEEVQSGVKLSERVTASELRRGQRLTIRWRPDRRIVVKHTGEGHFVVMESEHSKLNVGDTFTCHLMLQHEPLYLDQLEHEGMPPRTYVAGERNGVTIEVMD